ncbi:MAG: hypothetical protein IIY78_05150 [Clostridia bacterium]|nr:hypothetical protein [Clostridia bacterium]
MKINKAAAIGGGVAAVAGIVGVAVAASQPASLIIALGVRGIAALKVGSWAAVGVGVAAGAGSTVPAVKDKLKHNNDVRLIESRQNEEQKSLEEYAHDSLNPEKTSARLIQLAENNPKLTELTNKCLDQLEKMDGYQKKHKSLLDANDAVYLRDTIEVINESERRMCRNMRNIINCCILVEDGSGGIEDLDADIISTALSDNEDELNSVGTLLKYSVSYINNFNKNGVKDRSELDAWLKVTKAYLGDKNENY